MNGVFEWVTSKVKHREITTLKIKALTKKDRNISQTNKFNKKVSKNQLHTIAILQTFP